MCEDKETGFWHVSLKQLEDEEALDILQDVG